MLLLRIITQHHNHWNYIWVEISYLMFDLFQSLNLCRDNSISFVQNKATSPLFRTQLLFIGWKTSPQVVLEQSPNYDRMNYNQITIKAEYEHLLFPTILFLKFYYILLGRLSKWHTSNMPQGPNWISLSFFCLRLDEKWLLVKKITFYFPGSESDVMALQTLRAKKFMFWPKKRRGWHQGTYR